MDSDRNSNQRGNIDGFDFVIYCYSRYFSIVSALLLAPPVLKIPLEEANWDSLQSH